MSVLTQTRVSGSAAPAKLVHRLHIQKMVVYNGATRGQLVHFIDPYVYRTLHTDHW
jgi:hypothetical protein